MNSSLKEALGISDSRYAEELAKGAVDMQFPPQLEREYHTFYLNERRSHVRSFNTIMCGLATWAFLMSWYAQGPTNGGPERFRLGAITIAYAFTVWASRSRHYVQIYLRAAHAASLLISVLASIEVAVRIVAGQGEVLALLTTYSIGLYFLAGILYRAALQANVALVVSFGATLLALGKPAGTVVYLVGILTSVAAIGGLAFRHQGIRFRRAFLERGLIGELAARDGLTGLTNRRAFDSHLVRTWQQALRDRRPIVIMMIDVDCFKAFNDHYGHQAGDSALQRIAALIHRFPKRALDLAARYGGEELIAVFYDITQEDAARLAEEIRVGVLELGIEHRDSEASAKVTVSIGVAFVHPTLTRSPNGAVQLADEALYTAKRNGRNRVQILETEYIALSTGSFRLR